MSEYIINEKQLKLIQEKLVNEERLNDAKKKWDNFSPKEKKLVEEIGKVLYPESGELISEAKWYNLVGDILGIADPTGIVDIINGISYFSQGDHLFGMLSLISAIPYAGDVAAKPVMGALKIGGAATKELKVAMELAKVGKTAEASASLAKLAKEPGVVGKFLQSARNWAPSVAAKVEKLPGGVLKGFKKTILDYLKLFENAGAKSYNFQKLAGNYGKYLTLGAKPAEKIAYLSKFLKDEKIVSNLTRRGPLSQIFLGGAPRLFGNRRMRILMRQTKWWLGFLDYIGVANFVGPEELAGKMSESDIKKKMEEYNQTQEAQQYAKEDFPSQEGSESTSQTTSNSSQSSSTGQDPFSGWLGNIFQNRMGSSLLPLL